jgi:peptide chain release factor 3
VLRGLDDPALDRDFPQEAEQLRSDIELVRAASGTFALDAFLAGKQTPVFFGSGINNFGVREILGALAEWAPPPQPRAARVRRVFPTEPGFTAFVFKIQANMDPQHRDRIAFVRVCSGRYHPGIKVRHVRLGREMKIANAVTFMANERARMDDAVAGDILGIHNHGQLQIGDTLSESGELLAFEGIPYFAPELFSAPRLRDPMKSKPLQKGLRELGEEGAVQVFESLMDSSLLIGAIGPLQFEVVQARLRTEYGVDASFERAGIQAARWITFDEAAQQKEFERAYPARLARDVDGNLVYLVDSRHTLAVTMERWPKVRFHETREHGQLLS